MQVLYALPFMLLSAIGLVVCLSIPTMRRFTIAATVGPVAFGFCSVIGLLVAVLAADYVGRELTALLGFAYVISGILGAWVSVAFTRRIGRQLGW